MRATRCTILFGTRRAWLVAFLHASRVAALDLAVCFTERAWLVAMTWDQTQVPAARKCSTARPCAVFVFLLDDGRPFPYTAVMAFFLAVVAAGQRRSTWCAANVSRTVDIQVARFDNIMTATRNYSLDRHTALGLARVLELPTR